MKVGDLVKRVGITPDDIADGEELGVGVIIGIEDLKLQVPAHDFIVMWSRCGVGWEYPPTLELISES